MSTLKLPFADGEQGGSKEGGKAQERREGAQGWRPRSFFEVMAAGGIGKVRVLRERKEEKVYWLGCEVFFQSDNFFIALHLILEFAGLKYSIKSASFRSNLARFLKSF